MAKKKINTSKIDLGLGKKRTVKKTPTINVDSDEVVKKIHADDVGTPVGPATTKKEKPEKQTQPPAEPTKRITLDIPVRLHKRIKMHVFELETTMKKYFLELAEKDLAKNK